MLRLEFSVALVVLATLALAPAADESPLTIAVSTVGDFAKGGSWYLSVNSGGKAELAIEPSLSQPKRIRRQFDITKEQLAAFQKALNDESFFELSGEYGQRVPDGSTRTLTVIRGDRVKSVQVRFLMNWAAANDKEKLREPSRAVRLLVLARGWFNDPEAADLRRYDQRVLEAAK
jgi:hypothetical protein